MHVYINLQSEQLYNFSFPLKLIKDIFLSFVFKFAFLKTETKVSEIENKRNCDLIKFFSS